MQVPLHELIQPPNQTLVGYNLMKRRLTKTTNKLSTQLTNKLTDLLTQFFITRSDHDRNKLHKWLVSSSLEPCEWLIVVVQIGT